MTLLVHNLSFIDSFRALTNGYSIGTLSLTRLVLHLSFTDSFRALTNGNSIGTRSPSFFFTDLFHALANGDIIGTRSPIRLVHHFTVIDPFRSSVVIYKYSLIYRCHCPVLEVTFTVSVQGAGSTSPSSFCPSRLPYTVTDNSKFYPSLLRNVWTALTTPSNYISYFALFILNVYPYVLGGWFSGFYISSLYFIVI
jgi:hypothetical protein